MSIGNDSILCYTIVMFVANSDNILGDQSFYLVNRDHEI